jgi:hypothetical protein
MTIVAQNSIGTAVYRYLIVGISCFSIGYIKGCEHGRAMNIPSGIETTIQSEMERPTVTKLLQVEKNATRSSYTTN